jgi:hypothetical protein
MAGGFDASEALRGGLIGCRQAWEFIGQLAAGRAPSCRARYAFALHSAYPASRMETAIFRFGHEVRLFVVGSLVYSGALASGQHR